MINKQSKKGFSLIEMMIYVAVLSATFILVVNTLLVVARSYRQIVAVRDINTSSITLFDRIVREIRQADSIDSINSTFGSSPGRLTLNTTVGGSPTTIEFYVETDIIKVKEGGVYIGDLVSSGVDVTSFLLERIQSTSTDAVKIEATLSRVGQGFSKVESFYTTALMR